MGALICRRNWAYIAFVLAVLWNACGSASAQLAQTINFPPIADRFSYQSPFVIAATASSGLPVSFSSTRDICRVSGTTVTLVSAGICTIIADQPGDGTYAAAPLVSRSFHVLADTAAPQTQITLAPQANTRLTSAEFAFSGDDGPGILASLQCSLDGAPFATCSSPVSFWNLAEQPHTFQVRAVDLAGNVDLTPASHTWTVDITPPGPITIGSPAAGSLTSVGPIIAGVGAEPNAGIFVEEGAALVCATRATASGEWSCISSLGAGTHEIRVYQSDVAGNAGPASAPITITVKKSATITLSSGANPSQGGQALTMTAAFAGTPLPTGSVVFRDGSTPIEGCINVGIASAQARCTTSALTPGDHQITVAYSGDNEYISSTSAVFVQTVNGLPQTITFGALAGTTFGAAPFAVSATASSGLTVAFSSLSPSVCSVAGNLVTLAGAGQCTIAADQSGDTQYNPASRVTQTFEVAKAAQAIAFGPAPVIIVGGSGSILATGGGSGNPVTLESMTPGTCTISGVTVVGLAEGTCTIAADQAGSSNYLAAARATQSFTVGPANPARLRGISTRMQVLTGDDAMIGGFIIGGTSPKTVVVRARGPSLAYLGVPGTLANPRLDLYAGQTVIASNDDWQAAPNAAALSASGYQPSEPAESAILVTLNPGPYTAIVSGVGGGTGVGIIEVFEVDRSDIPLLNIATRGKVLTGDDVMIGGFIIEGSSPQTVVVRAGGPSLSARGVPGVLANPVLNLYSGQTVIASNDDWQTASNAATLVSSGFAPLDTRESAIYITLNPGAYTAIVFGAGGTTGVGTIEVFVVP